MSEKKLWIGRLLRFLLVMIILLSTSSSISQIKTGPQEKIVEMGDEVPYYGILVPPERYISYKKDLEICQVKEKHARPCEQQNELIDYAAWGFMGFALGFVGGVLSK